MSHTSERLTRRKFLNGIAGSVFAASNLDAIQSLMAGSGTSINQSHFQIGEDLPPPVMFRRGHSPIIVASPRSPFAHKILHRLTEYLSATLGVRPEIKQDRNGVPASAQTMVLAYAGGGAPRGVVPPVGSPEGFALATRKTRQASTVVLVGNSDPGLRRAVDRLILVSDQNPDGLQIPSLNISEKP